MGNGRGSGSRCCDPRNNVPNIYCAIWACPKVKVILNTLSLGFYVILSSQFDLLQIMFLSFCLVPGFLE